VLGIVFTGELREGVGWISRWPPWSTYRYHVRHGSSLSGRRKPVDLRRRSSSAAFCHIKDVRCQTDLKELWMKTHVLQRQVPNCGTTFQLNCDKLTLAFNDLHNY